MMVWLYRYFYGRLKIRFYGEFPERILNLCAVGGIVLWGSKFKDDSIIANITVKDFYKLKEMMHGTGMRLHILDKSGFPFFVSRYKRRCGLFIGLLLFIGILQLLSSFIWIIDVNGNSSTDYNEIISACEEIGIRVGTPKADINPKTQRERLLLKLDSLSWAALNIEGSRLTVNVSEAKKEKVKDNAPCNLKAELDGIIKKIDVTSGNCVVKVGDAVKKGDVLVSGIIETAGGTRFVRSDGSIIAQVEKSYTLSEKFKIKKDIETGKTKTKTVIELFGLKIPLYLGAENKPYNESSEKVRVKLLNKNLPLTIYKKEFRYKEKMTENRSEEKLKNLLENEMKEILKAEKNDKTEIINKEFSSQTDGITLKFTLSCEQNIVNRDFLLINAGN